jgi:hypothetical protein
MKLGIMQPYFFPYMGYFHLLHDVDLFIVYDKVQFIKQGWINRNRILHPNKSGWQYIYAPVDRASFHRSFQTPILDVKIESSKGWKQHILGQLDHYKKAAPFATETIDFVKECLARDIPSISRLNVSILDDCSKLLKLDFQYRFCSELDFVLDTNRSAEERILDLCEYFRADEYVNLPGGINLYHAENFKNRNIKLTFQNLPTYIYDTGPYSFEPNLSIIDLLMWNSPGAINRYLEENRDKG